jgi:hypothetical protein
LEAHVGQFLLGWKCAVSRGIVQEDSLGDLPAARCFSFKMSLNFTSRDEYLIAFVFSSSLVADWGTGWRSG